MENMPLLISAHCTPVAMSGRAIEAAGDVDVLLLDKTGTITLGNRLAVSFIPVDGHAGQELAEAARLASLADETPEGRSIVQLANSLFPQGDATLPETNTVFVPFSAHTRMSGVDASGSSIRKGAADAVRAFAEQLGGHLSTQCDEVVQSIARQGGTPLVVARDAAVLGVIHLKDVIKDGVREKFGELRRMGIRTVMITGDNPLTAAAIAAEAGVDDFLAEATPETKLNLIREYQAKGHLVAMQARQSAVRALHTELLLGNSRRLQKAKDEPAILLETARQLGTLLGCETTLYSVRQGLLETRPIFPYRADKMQGSGSPRAASRHSKDTPKDELGVAQWVAKNNRPAGAGTDSLPGSRHSFIPISSQSAVLAVAELHASATAGCR